MHALRHTSVHKSCQTTLHLFSQAKPSTSLVLKKLNQAFIKSYYVDPAHTTAIVPNELLFLIYKQLKYIDVSF